jgi:N-acetylglucosaminyl-diphospho-decaprenol L-rhamnosyltransferase
VPSLTWTFLAALGSALVLTAVVRAPARRFGILDRPDGKRKLHPRPVALCGGVAVYLALLIGMGVGARGSFGAGPALHELAVMLGAAAGFVCLFGVVDDCRHLHARAKLLLQVGAVTPIVALGYWFDQFVLFGVPVQLGWFGAPLTVLWLVGCINAVNLLDGMDGLAATVGLITAVMMSVIGTQMGHPHVAVIALALAGALAGFLFHNLPPARIFLGDSGSMVIGLVLGVLAIQGAMKTSATVAMTAPLAVMSLPMLDTLLAVVRRKLNGRSFDSADREHIHHRLLDRGLNQWQALGVLGGICLLTGLAAIASLAFRRDAIAWAATFLVVALAVRLRWFGHHELALARGALARQAAGLARRLAALARRVPAPAPTPESLVATKSTASRAPGASIVMDIPQGGTPEAPDAADVDVGVVFTHERHYMPRLLATLAASAAGLRQRLILVDNASAEGVEPYLDYFPDTTVLRNSRRLHYAANLNRILEASQSPLVLLLNTDMYFDPAEQCVAKMVQFMRARAECGLAGCRLHHADGSHAPSARRIQTPAVVLARRFGLGRLLPGTLERYFYEEHAADESWECEWLSGCFLMVRREAFEEVGSFDAGFVKYFEDVDYCLRMARAGWSVTYHGGTYCHHLEQRASRRLLSLDALRHARSYLRWLLKWGFAPEIEVRRAPTAPDQPSESPRRRAA